MPGVKGVHLDLLLPIAMEEADEVGDEVLAVHPREVVGLPSLGCECPGVCYKAHCTPGLTHETTTLAATMSMAMARESDTFGLKAPRHVVEVGHIRSRSDSEPMLA